jgi:hypothetical protein
MKIPILTNRTRAGKNYYGLFCVLRTLGMLNGEQDYKMKFLIAVVMAAILKGQADFSCSPDKRLFCFRKMKFDSGR